MKLALAAIFCATVSGTIAGLVLARAIGWWR
jgi:hypothetical protein